MESVSADTAPPATTSRWRAVQPLVWLSVVALFYNADSNSLFALAGTIQRQFGFTDTQVALIENAPVFLSAVFGILIALYADRNQRLRIVAVGLVVWVGLTAIRGFADGFVSLLVLCALSGIGFGSQAAPATSLLCDYYPPRQRSQAMGIQGASQYVGAVLGFLVPGLLLLVLDWRLIFPVIAAASLPFVLPLLLLKEPQRGAFDGGESTIPGSWWRSLSLGAKSLLTSVGGRVAVFGFGVQAFAIGAIGSFLAIYLAREFPISSAEADSLVSGVIFVIIFGALGGGFLDGWLRARVGAGSHAVVAGGATLGLGLLFSLAILLHVLLVFLLLTLVCGVLLGLTLAPLTALLGDIVSATSRSYSFALQMAVASLGQVLGGILLGVLSDWFHSLPLAFFFFSIVLILVGGWMLSRYPGIQRETGGGHEKLS